MGIQENREGDTGHLIAGEKFMGSRVIELNRVTKIYKLFKNNKRRFLSTFVKTVTYKEKVAVQDITFSVDKGESVAIFGRNGAGKSTILKMITGVSYPTYGSIRVKGRVGALLELTSGFDPEFSGRENIYLKGQLTGMTDREIEAVEDEIVEFAEVGEYIDQPLRTYSSGMKARLGFAINVCIKPDILIVDEALSVGDKKFSAKCLDRVKELIEKEGITLLFVTHATATAKKFCKRGIVLRAGRILYDGDINSAISWYNESLKRKENTGAPRITSESENRMRKTGKMNVIHMLILIVVIMILIVAVGASYRALF